MDKDVMAFRLNLSHYGWLQWLDIVITHQIYYITASRLLHLKVLYAVTWLVFM